MLLIHLLHLHLYLILIVNSVTKFQDSRRQYEQAMASYKPQKKKKDPNAPKQPLSAYFIFSSEERLKVR